MPTYQLTPSQRFNITATPAGDGWRIQVNDRVIEVEAVERLPEGLRIRMHGRWRMVYVSRAGKVRWISHQGRACRFEQVAAAARRGRGGATAGDGQVRSPMPGQVRAVHAIVGDAVSQGQTLMLLEAMKMEIRIQAPCEGVVAEIRADEGGVVEKDQVLVVVACSEETKDG